MKVYYGEPISGTSNVTLFANSPWNDDLQQFDNCTYITYKTQGYVHSIDAANKYIYLFGHDYAFKVNDTIFLTFAYVGSIFVSAWYTISGTTETTADDGTSVTQIEITTTPNVDPKYTIAVGNRVYLNNESLITATAPASDTIYIGYGHLHLNGSNTDATYGPYALISASPTWGAETIMCPHLPGCIVSTKPLSSSAPETDSPCNIFGDITKSFSVDQNTNMSILEIYATNYLLNKSLYYKKSSFLCFFYDWYKTELRPTVQVTEAGWLMEGDRIAVLQNTADTALDVEYGDYKNQYQILSWSLDADKMVVTCELGDFETNMNTLINDKTTAINTPIT
jgi:hypothetical protein